jgi:hypothetical protein
LFYELAVTPGNIVFYGVSASLDIAVLLLGFGESADTIGIGGTQKIQAQYLFADG